MRNLVIYTDHKVLLHRESRLWEAGYVARMEKAMNAYRIFAEETSWKMENQKYQEEMK
jgi:hypothetical protein